MRGGRADRHRPALLYTYIYGEVSGPYGARLWGVFNMPLRLRFLFFDRQGRGVLHTPRKTSPTRGRMRFFGCVDGAFIGIIRALPCPFVGRMLLRPYPDGRLFSSEWVGAYCIRPTRRPRQGDECGYSVISHGNLLGASGPYGARLWGVCCCALRLRFLFFDRQGRAQQHTPHQTSPTRG